MTDNSLIAWIFKVTVVTLAIVVLAVVGVLLVGLFNNDIDNAKIFEIVGPAFNTVIGAFVGLLGGLSLNGNNRNNTRKKPTK